MQKHLLWERIHGLTPLEKLERVCNSCFFKELISVLEQARGKGRNDFPVQYMWELLMERYAFSSSTEDLRRNYLARFQENQASDRSCPSAATFSRFFTTLTQYIAQIYTLLHRLLVKIQNVMPDLGKIIAVEQFSMNAEKHSFDDGFLITYFQYLLDVNYDIPILGGIREGSISVEQHVIGLLEQMKKNSPSLLNGCNYFVGKEGYDQEYLIAEIWDQYKIKPVIALQVKSSRQGNELPLGKDVFYDENGDVFCRCLVTTNRERMQCFGFEEKRKALRYKCTSGFYGLCNEVGGCIGRKGIRVPLKRDRRLFTPLARSYYQWSKIYQSWNSQYSSEFFRQTFIDRSYLRRRNANLEYVLSHCFLLVLILSILEEGKK